MDYKELVSLDAEQFDNLEEEARQGFIVDSPEKADWCIETIKNEKTRFNTYKQVAESKIDILKAQISSEEHKSATRNSYLLFKLNEYLDNENTPTKKTKTSITLNLPSGKVVRKLPKMDFVSLSGEKELKKDKSLLDWCKDNAPDMVKQEETVAWGELKKDLEIHGEDILVKSTGEIIDCIGITEKPMSVDVE